MTAGDVDAGPPERAVGFEDPRGVTLLWFGLLGGPAAWFLDLIVKYSLVRYVCEAGAGWTLTVTAAVTVGLAGAAVMVALRNWRRLGEPTHTSGAGPLGRSRFMALSGIAVSSFFMFITVLTVVPPLVLEPCSITL